MSEPFRKYGPIPNFVDACRTLRAVQELGYYEARDEAVRAFHERGWPVPEWAEQIGARP